jgi:hypothetical protein
MIDADEEGAVAAAATSVKGTRALEKRRRHHSHGGRQALYIRATRQRHRLSWPAMQAIRPSGNAEFFINEHLKVRREDALRVWCGDKAKEGWELDPAKEMVYCPTIEELTDGCGLPLYLSCDAPGHWYAQKTPDTGSMVLAACRT